MATPNDSQQARANRLASMTRTSTSGPVVDPEARAFEGRTRLKEAATIRRDRIFPDPNQPRNEFDEEQLQLLAQSIKDRGQLQPIRVRYDVVADRYVIVVGERRWRAAVLAGLETLACVVVDATATPEDLLEDQLVENCLRQDLRPIEQARSYQVLMAARGLSQRALAERLHVSPASVAKAVALLNLPQPIQASVDAGTIGPDTAYQLSKVEDADEQRELADQAVAGAIRRDELQARTRSATPRQGRGARRPWSYDHRGLVKITVAVSGEDIDEDVILEALKAALSTRRKGKGRAA